MKINIHLTVIVFLLLTSCGKNKGNSNGNVEEEISSITSGNYRALLTGVNPKISSDAFATVSIEIENNEIKMETHLINAASGVKHFQAVHLLGNCPLSSDDLNQDGYIDIIEAMNKTGPILVPLDGDLSSQQAGDSYAPSSDGTGTYHYSESTTLSLLLSDLQNADEDTSDQVVKLGGSGFGLSGKTFLILGVSSMAALPETVATIHGESNEATLPIACGRIVRINKE